MESPCPTPKAYVIAARSSVHRYLPNGLVLHAHLTEAQVRPVLRVHVFL